MAGPGRLSTMASPRGGAELAGEMSAIRGAGADVVVCMLAPSEIRHLGLNEEAAVAQAAGLRFIALPTPDHGLPEVAAFRALVAEVVAEVRSGRHVVVHCWMGIGRSSMVVGAALMTLGMEPADAWAAISAARGYRVPDSEDQRRWVEANMEPLFGVATAGRRRRRVRSPGNRKW
jgi:protein-tyrosine phosphatase